MYKITYNEELSHHGIAGQKWGHRNGPPYPLDASAHSKAEKDAMASKSGSSSSGRDVSAGKKFVADNAKSGWSDLDSDTQVALVELGILTTALAVSAASTKIYEAKETKRLTKKLDDMYENREIKTLADVPKLSKKMSAEESMKVVNPDFPEEGSVQNCMLCTTAMIMREKGYNVKANKIDEGIFEKNLDKAFDGPNTKFKKLRLNDTDQIYDKLAKEGDGSYGNLTVQFWLGGGHSVFWKVENGEARIYDAQSGEEYKRNAAMDENNMMMYVNPVFTKYNRCDNAEPTEYVLGLIKK